MFQNPHSFTNTTTGIRTRLYHAKSTFYHLSLTAVNVGPEDIKGECSTQTQNVVTFMRTRLDIISKYVILMLYLLRKEPH